jgi:hypothetical protein
VPKAKRLIFLFMAGGPSQPDLFDPKPYIQSKHGETIDSPLSKNVLQVGTDKYLALGTMAPVLPRGQSGVTTPPDLMPHLSSVADDICMLRGMSADNPQHAGATLQFHTGTFAEVRPSMGSWISYGRGTENQNLPSFISIHPLEECVNTGLLSCPQYTNVHQPHRSPQKRRTRLKTFVMRPSMTCRNGARMDHLTAGIQTAVY